MFCVAAGDVGKRVREARKAYGDGTMRTADLAKSIGVDQRRLGNWERGQHDPPHEMVQKIADALSLNPEWLYGETVPMKDPTRKEHKPILRGGVRWVPIYGAISAGPPSSNQGDILEWYEMRDWGGDFDRWGRVVEGFSMEPYLEAGDWAIFENRQWEPGHVVHAYHDGSDTIKQVRKVEGRPTLYPCNSEYDPIDAASWHVKGVCVAYVRREPDGSTTLREYPQGMRPKIIL